MLFELMIENFALIKKLNVHFQQGLNIITGETGAGKSIIIDAVNLAIGERADKSLIRTGEEKAVVQVVFHSKHPQIAELFLKNGIDHYEDGLIIITREIYNNGRSTSRINDKLVTISLVKEVSKFLIDIHGQHSHQSLLYAENHIDMLDLFQGKEISSLLKIHQKKFNELRDIEHKLKVLNQDDLEKERKKDILTFQIREIDNASLGVDEEKGLSEQHSLLANSEKIFNVMAQAYERINNGDNRYLSIIDGIAGLSNDLESIKTFDNTINDIFEVIQDVLFKLQDTAIDIRTYRDQIEFEPSTLEEIESRLDIINKLKRKYGKTIVEILEYRDEIDKELQEIVNSQYLIDELNNKLDELKIDLLDISKELSEKRNLSGQFLEKKMNAELRSLNMGKATFKVDIHLNKDENGNILFSAKGIDKVEFLISTNAGEPLKPLIKIASGGEISRIMLAIKTILAKTDNIATIIFDEIDTGISGRTANIVGEKLAFISKTHQILCVTHLPQIASMADVHFYIEKDMQKDFTTTNIRKLLENEQIGELTRLLGGVNITDLTFEHAREMLLLAQKYKTIQ